jgi:glycosyltransferase involved in cell wall biosynthesis
MEAHIIRVSVVIPVYQRQIDGVRAVRSVLAQQGALGEIVVVDDHSPDPFVLPPDIAADGRVRLIRHESNLGEAGARNTGIAAARCEWIAFLDSDDYWLPGKLAAQTAFAEHDQRQQPDPLVLYGTGFVRYKTSDKSRRALYPIESSQPHDFASGCWFMPGSTIMFSKTLAEKTGAWDTKLRRSVDLDWYLRATLQGARLRVAPVVGAVIEIGARPTPAAVDAACRQLAAKWIDEGSAMRLPAAARRRLAAYIDVERASAARSAQDYLHTALYLARSLVRVPRSSVHLRRWWRPAPMPSDPIGNPA